MKNNRSCRYISKLKAAELIILSFMVVAVIFPAQAHVQTCTICNIVERIETGSIASVIRALSGEDSVTVESGRELITTRYAFSPQIRIAMEYLGDMAESYGYQPEFRPFVLAVDTPDLTGITSSAGGDSVWVGSIDGDIYLSTSASGWSRFEKIGSMDGRVFDLTTAANGDLIAACKKKGSGFGSIYSSVDGGRNWVLEHDGALSSMYQFNTITLWNEMFGIAGGHGGSFLNTAEGGHSWFIAAGADEFSYLNINGSTATGPMHYWVACDGGYVFESVDFGNNWTSTRLSVTRLTDIDFFDSLRGVVVGIGEVFYTVDGGVVWTEVSHPADLQSVTMLDSVNVLATGGGGDIWMSEDGGANWTSLGTDCTGTENVWRLRASSDGQIWVAGSNEISRVGAGWPVVEDCEIYTLADTTFGQNIVFERQGWKYPDRKIILCGHYDSINRETDPLVCAPGADDNASGTSIVLECARVLAGVSLEKTVEFVLFDGEENGLIGSSVFAAAVDTTEVTYEALINIDMVGADYSGDGMIRLGAIDETPDTVLVNELTISSDGYSLQYPLDWYYRAQTNQPMSDDLAFKGILDIPAVSLIEAGYRDNPHYHNCSDLFEHLDMDYMLDVARIVLATAARMGGVGLGPSPAVVLHQNFPNPFFSTTGIIFETPERSHVSLVVYDVAGRKVRVLENSILDADVHPRVWDGLNDSGQKVASGVYFLRLETCGVERSLKIVRMH